MGPVLSGIADSIHHAMKNPFGLDFEVHNNNLYIPFGSAINCIGYNDYLERIVGAARVCFALIALATSPDTKGRVTAAGHIFRGIMEMMGDFEKYLLILDTLFTVYNIAYRVLSRSSQLNSEQEAI